MNSIAKIHSLFFIALLLGCSHAKGKSSTNISHTSDLLVKRSFYELSYNEDHEVANWVAYTLEKNQLRACVSRNDNFKSDPLVITGSSALDDYKGSGFDRGHLLPAGDMKFDTKAMDDTFYLSNITPQPGKFNRGAWARLEKLVRAWALNAGKSWIVTGPILNNSLQVIGKTNKVSVPYEYYKVILKKEGSSYVGIGLLMNTDVPYPELSAYVLDINTVEKLSGIDFFSFLEDKVEEKIEGEVDLSKWDFKASFDYIPCGA